MTSSAIHTVWPDHLFVDLDRTGPVPLYYQVSTRLESAIRSGELPPGSRLHNEIAIADQLGISRPTIRRAIQELVDQGLLVRRRGIGTQVVQHAQVTRPVELTSLYEDLQNSRQHPATSVLAWEVTRASEEIAQRLSLPDDAKVIHIRRLRSAEGVPIAILENYLPEEFQSITAEVLEENGLYQALRARGVGVRIANQTIGARAAGLEEGRLLEISKGGAMLVMERVTFDTNGRAVEFGTHCYRPDMYSFQTTLVAK